MSVKIKIQKDYYVNEVSLELPANVSDVDELLKLTRTNGKMVVQYNQGNIQGINIEQRTKLSDAKSSEIRPLLDIPDKIL
jgi:hypothetical protein